MKKRILVAPLNWGLGHATRCIPIIRELQRQGAEVLLASDGRALQLLREEFPDLLHFELPAYNMRYPFSSMILSIGWQLPKIVRAIWLENKAIDMLIEKQKIDVIISDNRFGCFLKKVKTVFLTHQLTIKMPFKLLETPVRWGNFYWIRKFDECWIPDFEGENSLSGELSEIGKSGLRFTKILKFSKLDSKQKLKFIGILSRMKSGILEKKYLAIFILSGPEPQRTFFESAILIQLQNLEGDFLIVQGKTESKERIFLKENIEVVSFMTSEELNEAILKSEIVVSRSGYSTLMDLANLQQKAILIPTPGQTEQEYLAKRFFKSGVFYYQKQEDLDLKVALENSEKFTGFQNRIPDENLLKKAIAQLLQEET
ncbi:MAG: UDP:flavonoid glycosyltransferase YjiC (YdhE family) [Paraglaciecola sp.]